MAFSSNASENKRGGGDGGCCDADTVDDDGNDGDMLLKLMLRLISAKVN